MNDALSKWLQLADSNQMDRLRRAMLRYMGKDLTKDIEEGEIMVGEVSC